MADTNCIARIPDPVEEQVKVRVYEGHKNYVELKGEDVPEVSSDEALITLENEDGLEGYMVIPRRGEYEISSGVSDLDAMEDLCRQDSLTAWRDQPEKFMPDDYGWDREYDKEVWYIKAPSIEEIEGFREEYSERLDEAETEQEEREIIEEAWEEAAAFEPEGREEFGR